MHVGMLMYACACICMHVTQKATRWGDPSWGAYHVGGGEPLTPGHVCVYVYISEGLRPLPPAPKLEDPMIGGLDDSMNG